MDKDFFGLGIQELYDQNGALWKGGLGCIFYTRKPYAGYPVNPLKGAKYNYEDEWPFVPSAVMVDLQQETATISESPSSAKPSSEWYYETYFNEPVADNTPDVYSPNYLVRSAR